MITPAAFGSNPSGQRVASSAVASLRFAPSRSALRSASLREATAHVTRRVRPRQQIPWRR